MAPLRGFLLPAGSDRALEKEWAIGPFFVFETNG
jgi:hypothetical protein